jgi:hypothetical protein
MIDLTAEDALDIDSTPDVGDYDLKLHLDEDLKRYMRFLERIKHVKDKEEAALSALRIFKKLNMHEWMPYIYRNGSERILIVSQGMLNDVLSAMSEKKLYQVARTTALKRKVLESFDPELDLGDPDNWDVVLNELENMGWGRFIRDETEIMIEFLGVPLTFLRGYLEMLFRVEFKCLKARQGELMVLSCISTRPIPWE